MSSSTEQIEEVLRIRTTTITVQKRRIFKKKKDLKYLDAPSLIDELENDWEEFPLSCKIACREIFSMMKKNYGGIEKEHRRKFLRVTHPDKNHNMRKEAGVATGFVSNIFKQAEKWKIYKAPTATNTPTHQPTRARAPAPAPAPTPAPAPALVQNLLSPPPAPAPAPAPAVHAVQGCYCNECKKQFRDNVRYKRHMKDVHGGKVICSDTVIKIKNRKFVPDIVSDEYVIVGCQKEFKSDDVKVIHIYTVHIGGNFICKKCGSPYESLDKLKNHTSGRRKKQNTCS